MTLGHLPIPTVPDRPRVHPIAKDITRSYTPGRQNYSRACQSELLTLTITGVEPLPPNVMGRLLLTEEADETSDVSITPFERTDDRTLTCWVVPKRTGLHSFRTEFSLDGGVIWLHDTITHAWVLVDPPQVDGLRLYTMIPAVSGKISDWKADLRRIKDLGFDAIHLLPITAQDASQSPYSAHDLFTVDQAYLADGSDPNDLTQVEDFVEEAKKLEIKLCFDLVLNHVGVTSTIATKAPDWIVPDQLRPDGLARAKFLSDTGWHNWEDLVLINYEHPSDLIRSEIWNYFISYALFWAKYANDTDGFVRFDNLHSSEPNFVEALTAAMRSKYPAVGLLAEYFTDEHTLLNTIPDWGMNLLLATPWEFRFVPGLREYLVYLHRVSGQLRYYMPLTSHDSGTPAQEFGTVESTIPRYVAAALLGTGATGIVQGVESGELEKVPFIGKQPKKAFTRYPHFDEFFSKVNRILDEHPAFRKGGNCDFVDKSHHAVIAAYRRGEGPKSHGFLVACNFDIMGSQTICVDLKPFLEGDRPFKCMELLTDEIKVFPNPLIELTLPPCGVTVLRIPR